MFGRSKPKAPQSMAELQTQFTANAESIMQEQDKLQGEAEARIAELEAKKAKEQEKSRSSLYRVSQSTEVH